MSAPTSGSVSRCRRERNRSAGAAMSTTTGKPRQDADTVQAARGMSAAGAAAVRRGAAWAQPVEKAIGLRAVGHAAAAPAARRSGSA